MLYNMVTSNNTNMVQLDQSDSDMYIVQLDQSVLTRGIITRNSFSAMRAQVLPIQCAREKHIVPGFHCNVFIIHLMFNMQIITLTKKLFQCCLLH